jgi:hypothetical protein
MIRKLLLCVLVLLPDLLLAGENHGNLEAVLNAFIASIAKDHPEYKADLRLWQAGDPVPPGYQLGKSDALGTYVFRPKVWTDLTDPEKAEVLANPRLKSFIVSLRNERVYPAVSAANGGAAMPGWVPVEGAAQVKQEFRVKVAPEEMVRNRPVVIPLTPVPAKE